MAESAEPFAYIRFTNISPLLYSGFCFYVTTSELENIYKNLKNVIKYPSSEANASTSPARGKVKKYRLLFSNNRFSLAKIRIMSLMRNNTLTQKLQIVV